MGICFSKEYPHVAFLGPTDSGKTSLIYSLCNDDWRKAAKDKIPTNLINFEKIRMGKRTFKAWEVPGNIPLEPFRPLLYQKVALSAIVYVVDLAKLDNDEIALMQARNDIIFLLYEENLRKIPFCVFFNVKATKYNKDYTTNAKNRLCARMGLNDQYLKDRIVTCVGNAMDGWDDFEDCADHIFG